MSGRVTPPTADEQATKWRRIAQALMAMVDKKNREIERLRLSLGKPSR